MSVGSGFQLSDGNSYVVAAHDEPGDINYNSYRNLDEDLFQSVEIRRSMNNAEVRNLNSKQGSWALPVMRTSSKTLACTTTPSGLEINPNRFPEHRFVTLKLASPDFEEISLRDGIVAGEPL